MSVKSVDCLKKYEYLEGGLVVNEEARKLIAKRATTQNPGGSNSMKKCCHHVYCWDYEYLHRDEARDLVVRRVLKMAVSESPGTMIVTRENCWVETATSNCFVADGMWGWGLRGILYLHDVEVGEEAQRVINLARSVAQFDEFKAKVLKLTFKKGMWREKCWEEYDILYVGDRHLYCEYCLEPDLASDDIVAYVVLTSDNKLIPVATEEFRKHVW